MIASILINSNNYLDTVGEYKYYSKKDKSEWIVQNPNVKIQNDEMSGNGVA